MIEDFMVGFGFGFLMLPAIFGFVWLINKLGFLKKKEKKE